MSRYFENCIDCENRKPDCHSHCESYLKDKKLQTIENARKRKKYNADSDYISYKNDTANRLKRK